MQPQPLSLAGPTEPPAYRRELARNCAVSPQALGAAYAGAVFVALAGAAAWAAAGAWLALPFAGLEALAFAFAFVAHARAMRDRERVELRGGRLAVERCEGGRSERFLLEAASVRVCYEQGRLIVRSAGAQVELGRYLDEKRRCALAGELAERLRGAKGG